ncbi:DUF6194 family protein [Actinokineospora fastidiosa]|uniref:DUF6194 domain-containing protein n=1 Tax=Actinokineospora fastidiosa TaxID=1816 RepID=A0A918GTK5_9PSEU|nr:DUF6194 family protein [Actinokineospora fastidiosa]GGS57427.1 hypothetical protein GCM10010171_60460 [Actinokineospora fastidiosa]
MTEQEVIRQLLDLDGVIAMENSGDTFLIYDPHGDVPYNRRFPFATVVTGDSYDKASDLDRPGAFRLNLGLTKQTFRTLFPAAAPVTHTVDDQVMPHPVYAPQHWVCLVNPSRGTFEQARPLIQEAYDFAARKHRNRLTPNR